MREMLRFVDAYGRIVGRVSQGIVFDGFGRPQVTYLAEGPGLQEHCPRFACAREKVELVLMAMGVAAQPRLV